MTQFIKRLPPVLQTTTEKQFFDATFDQVFTKKDSSYLSGYLGRRNPGFYDPINDFYIPEPDKNRTWWQLEPTAYARNPDSTKSNIFFYEDLLNRINYYGGNTLNQDRLFESEYYSFGPPIDYDMFINYQNYYWVEQGLPSIDITGGTGHPAILGSDIIGQPSYTTPSTATPPNFTLSSGMTIVLLDDPAYPNPVIVENMGGCIGLKLVPIFSDFTIGTIFEFLPWDGNLQISTGRIIQNSFWDQNTWDTENQPLSGDYITIERGSLTRNAWSRTNKWFHIDVINQVLSLTGGVFPSNATSALRPIIQFLADLELYNSGTQFRQEIAYGFGNNQFNDPILFSEFNSQPVHVINDSYSVNLTTGDLIVFFNDTTIYSSFTVNQYIFQVTISSGGIITLTPYTSIVTPVLKGDIVLIDNDGPYDSAIAGSTWYFFNGLWQEAFNDKISINQPPLFQLYDYNGISLDDPITYPNSLFEGSEIFSYAIDTTPGAALDPVLGFPILYTALGQSSDILFNNDLITDRYTYSSFQPINGYYYYMIVGDPVLYNNWNLYNICSCNNIMPPPPVNCLEISKQRVIDQYVVGYGTLYQFQLSVTPYGYPISPDIIVSVNGIQVNQESITNTNGYQLAVINNNIYVELTNYLTNLFLTPQTVAPVVEIQTYTQEPLSDSSSGYFEIPQQLEANPTQLEIGEINGSDLIQHFSSIISNQINFTGSPYGGPNNYRDSRKNRSLGTYILQNVEPILKSMLISQGDPLDFIQAIRFSQNTYTKFKNKYTSVALQLINQEFNPVQYQNNSVIISTWVDQILNTINISKEFSNAFAYSYMVASGTPTYSETHITSGVNLITLTNYIDLTNPENVMYVYDATNSTLPSMLLVGRDYDIVSTNLAIDVQINLGANIFSLTSITGNGFSVTATYTGPQVPVGSTIVIEGVTGITAYNGTWIVTESGNGTVTFTNSVLGTGGISGATIQFQKTLIFYLYQNPLPTYIPSTPTKLGMYPTYIPGIEIDYSYAIPTSVLIGHDGSKTILFGDYRDTLLLELERRIYNGIQTKFRNQYYVPLRIESVKSGYFRQTRYTRQEYLDITQSYLNKWAAKNKANYGANNWASASQVTPVDELWKLYNYSDAINSIGQHLNLPGNWKGIFQYYYDTIYPDTAPWEMLGFSQQPDWWVSQYGAGVINSNLQISWPNTITYAPMWADLEAGIVRQGPTAIYDPYTLEAQPQPLWERPGLSSVIPVDSSGNIIPVPTLFNVEMTGDPYEPYDGFDNDWTYGDGGPVEQAWLSTSGYVFNTQEFLYLMRPGPFGELLWETLGTEILPGQLIDIPGVEGPVLSNTNWQYIQNDIYSNLNNDPLFYWMRPKNTDQYVHAETVNNIIQIRFGYQCWISDNILFSGADITNTFGQKIRTLDVNLANKFAGFTNETTINTYIQAVTPGTTTNTLVIPSPNVDVILQEGPPIATYTYSGVIVRALANGTFSIYGYDLLNSSFTVLNRTNDELINISVGGTPADYQNFIPNSTYGLGVIVKYNGVYYLSSITQTVDIFSNGSWEQLKSLPTVGGISVIYKPISSITTTVFPYGTILNTAQDVFDFMIGWGAYLSSQGWQFDDVDPTTNQISDWLYSAKQFLFWLNTSWSPNSIIQLSPLANTATLIVAEGYPNDVESMSNDVYSILDKYGTAILPSDIVVERNGKSITVSPLNLASGGIYFLLVNASETEHILIFDNTTNFNDIVYDPLLRARQERIQFNGFRTNNWYGKMEAAGYLIINNQLVPNYDTIVNSMRYFYDPNVILDNQSLEQLGRHLIGFNEKTYLDNMEIVGNTQYMFYQGAIRQKGTQQAIDNLFRSTEVQQSGESITIYEEWALKLGDFGSTVEQVNTEFILEPDQNSGQVVVARLNYVPSTIGFVKEILILNAQDTYTTVPKIIIGLPDANPLDPALTSPLRQATAYAILGLDNTISRVDIIDPGYGYLKAPEVRIDSGYQANNLDMLYSLWQGQYVIDTIPNNIIDISLSQTNLWTVRPVEPENSLIFPTTNNIDYILPNAGYVNFNDVVFASFDANSIEANWGSLTLNPVNGNTIWVANTFPGDWDVYKLVDISSITFQIQADSSNNLNLLIPSTYYLEPQYSTPAPNTEITDFGNMISLQIINATATATIVGGQITNIILNQEGANYYTIPTVSINGDGLGASATATIAGGVVTGFTNIIGGSGYTTANIIISPPLSVSGLTNYFVGFIFDEAQTNADPTHNYYDLVDLSGNPITSAHIPEYANITNLLLFKSMRIQPGQPVVAPWWASNGDKLWVDQVGLPPNNLWSVYTYNGTNLNLFRQQEPLINTSLFQSASIFDNNNNELTQLPTYDPFKGILPGPARQNITYITELDPASYNVTQDLNLFNENITFNSRQIGQLWWDLSSVKYVYYEQPIALDGSETETQNLVYRRNYWGQIFPGSTVNIYEWVGSTVPPSQYAGSGIPKDVNTYVQITSIDKLTNITNNNYYFWVLNATDQPNVENRTLPAVDVSSLLQSPLSQGFTFFNPIQQTSTNNSYMFYNVLDILSYQGNNIQVQYRTSERNDQKHAQWQFFREGDTNSIIPDQFWNKMVDSLCGYTGMLPVLPEFPTGISVPIGPAWDTTGWDTSPWDAYGLILPVPDPELSSIEQLGIEYRPRQGMFFNITSARQVFVESANSLLQYIPIRDNTPSWNNGLDTDMYYGIYWEYVNYYAVGYKNAIPTIIYPTLSAANAALLAGNLQLGTIIQVNNATADGLRFILYAVVQLNPNISTLSFNEIGIQNSAIMLLDTVYTTFNVYGLSVELRNLLNAFRTVVMIDEYLIDQNELFFSMLNYVVSEKKNPDWVFKSSNIYIKESNLQLSQTQLYIPDNIDNVINYIIDVKPYHTQIRDYTSSYTYTDIAIGTASDLYDINLILQFGPGYPGTLTNVPQNIVNAQTFISTSNIFGVNPLLLAQVDQFISGTSEFPTITEYPDSLFEVPLTFFDSSKVGYSSLFPYTFTFDGVIGLNPPQSFITPSNVIGVQIGDEILITGQDFYVEFNNDNTPTSDGTYTIYFFNNPGSSVEPVALVWWDGGHLQELYTDIPNIEIGIGYPIDDTVVNVDTKLVVNYIAGVYTGVIDAWDYFDAAIETILESLNGGPPPDGGSWLGWDSGPWNQDSFTNIVTLSNTISYKENVISTGIDNYYRNSAALQGTLVADLPAPISSTENLSVIIITASSDILPEPTPNVPGVIWINGERIEYKGKLLTSINTWELNLVRRGTMGTSAVDHPIGSYVFIEQSNIIPGAPITDIWNAVQLPGVPDPTTQLPLGWNADPFDETPWDDITPAYTSIENAALGGLWYATTPEAEFLKAEPGISIV